MFIKNIVSFSSVVGLVVLGALATGCAAEASSEETAGVTGESALMNPNNEGTFKLYAEGAPEPDASCDLHTVLDLVHLSRDGALRARFHETVTGVCKLAIDPDAREYRLVLDSTSCGSLIYKGVANKRQVTITDHRTRHCRDLVPAQIIVEETDASAPARTLLSQDVPVARATAK